MPSQPLNWQEPIPPDPPEGTPQPDGLQPGEDLELEIPLPGPIGAALVAYEVILGGGGQYEVVGHFINEAILEAQSPQSVVKVLVNFDIHNKLTPYKWRVKQVGYTIGMMFLKSYEKGETTYSSMISRGFSNDSEFYVSRKELTKSNYIFIISLVTLIIAIEIVVVFFTPQLGYFGLHFTAT